MDYFQRLRQIEEKLAAGRAQHKKNSGEFAPSTTVELPYLISVGLCISEVTGEVEATTAADTDEVVENPASVDDVQSTGLLLLCDTRASIFISYSCLADVQEETKTFEGPVAEDGTVVAT